MRTIRLRLAAALFAACCSTAGFASGTLVVSGDEWQLSDSAYASPYVDGTTAFVNDLAITFGGNSYLFLTGNGNIPQSALGFAAAQLQSLGKSVSFAAAFDPVADASFDAVFHFGQLVDPAAFGSFVQNGGNAYVSLGGGWWGTAEAEAAAWNPTLAQFGLVAGDSWFPTAGFVNADVSVGPSEQLLWGYGQSIEKLTEDSPSQSYVRGSFWGGADIGLIGASRPLGVEPPVAGVPEPGSWVLLIAGFGLVGAAGRRAGLAMERAGERQSAGA